VGDGTLRPRVEQEVERRRLRGRVLVLGTRGDVADILAASDIALLTSRAEGMPASIIEAGLCGVPVAAFSVAGVPEVIEDEVTGLLAPAADRERLGRALTRLLDDDERRLALGQGAERRCRALFDIARVAPRYLALYDSIPRAATLAPAGGRG
jgi:glycosyltransferase involved in cell wall biosynthesis